jgi:transcriptional regulator
MYLRAAHADLHIPTLYAFIRANPLGILTTAIPSPNYNTIQSSHIPWVLDVFNEDETVCCSTSLNINSYPRACPSYVKNSRL